MPQPPSRAESSRHAQKMPRNDSHRQKSGMISRGKWSSSQRHARSSQEVPSTFSQESNRRRATASKSQRREPDIGEEASEYEEEFQRHSQIDLQLHGERSLAKDGSLNAWHFSSSPLSSPPRDSQSHRQLSNDPVSSFRYLPKPNTVINTSNLGNCRKAFTTTQPAVVKSPRSPVKNLGPISGNPHPVVKNPGRMVKFPNRVIRIPSLRRQRLRRTPPNPAKDVFSERVG